MPRQFQDSPYRDDPKPSPASSSRSSAAQAPAPRHRPPRASRAQPTTTDEADAPRRRSHRGGRSGRGGRGGRGTYAQPQLTSHPTGRAAYTETRRWLLEQHGPVCAYCGRSFTADVMTLDHVYPRRGQTAYDRRDNLVLACPGCNAVKRDLSPTAFLLASRSRAANLLRYGTHLSDGLIEIARSLTPGHLLPIAQTPQTPPAPPRVRWSEVADEDDGESPYKD